jgi:hypothetical protein
MLFTHFSGRVLHRRWVLHFFRACFALAECFVPACFLRIFPGVFCTDGAFHTVSGVFCTGGRGLHWWGFLRILRACFAPVGLFKHFPGLFCTGGAFCRSPGTVPAVWVFYAFCRCGSHCRGVSRRGVICPRACDTAQACAPCRCVTHTRGVWH